MVCLVRSRFASKWITVSISGSILLGSIPGRIIVESKEEDVMGSTRRDRRDRRGECTSMVYITVDV